MNDYGGAEQTGPTLPEAGAAISLFGARRQQVNLASQLR
jgi:hypothetical protein